MSKTLFTAALAFVLSIGGFVLFADEPASIVPVEVYAKMDVDLMANLTASAANSGKQFGYKKRGGGFQALSEAIATKQDDQVSFNLGSFTEEDGFKLGFSNTTDGSDFNPASVNLKVASDAGFHGGFDTEGFYHLDFPEDQYDGMIEILVMGEPLPASTVTMLIALAAAAALLLFHNRRTRARFSAQA